MVQEITADGKVRDIVTERHRTQADIESEEKEDRIRNLPEFRQGRGEGVSLAEQLADQQSQSFEEEKAQPKEYNVHTIDEEEYEHYQNMADNERHRRRLKITEETAAVASFAAERKRLREDTGDVPRQDLLAQIQQHKRDRVADRGRAAPTAADRLRGRVIVKARTAVTDDAAVLAPSVAAKAPADSATAGRGAALVGYASDSEDS